MEVIYANETELSETEQYPKVRHLRSVEKDKCPTPEQLDYGEIAVNYNVDSPFIAFKTNVNEETGEQTIVSTVTRAELDKNIKEPIINNGMLKIPWAYDELLTKYNDLLERLVAIENELGVNAPFAYLEKVDLLDTDWKFNLISATANTAYTSTAEAAVSYDDSSWATVSVPHDWSIYRDFNSSCPGGSDAGWLDGGDGWYRRTLSISNDMSDKKIYVYFDGIYMESDIYINGTKVKTNKFGYNPFYIDITDYVNFSGTNVLAVFVRNQQPSSRFYSGSGIIRSAALLVGHTLSVGVGNIIVTTPNIETEWGKTSKEITTNVKVDLSASETKTVSVTVEILDSIDTVVGTLKKNIEIASGNTVASNFEIKVKKPLLWAIGSGNIYKAKVQVKYDKNVFYKTVDFGYRWFTFDVTNGFSLNGERMKLKGVCLHEDSGCLGNEANESAYERQIVKLTAMGINAIRMCHNPFPEIFVKLCEKHGILLLADLFDEWNLVKKGSVNETGGFYRFFDEHYQEVIRTVLSRDVNSPSIFAWLIGNEIIRANSYTQENAVAIAQGIINTIREYDSYRPITMGDDTPSDTISLAIADLLDIEGINYGSQSEYETFRAAKPTKPLFGSETTSALSSRGVYKSDTTNMQCSSMDDQIVSWGEGSSAAEILKRHMEDISYLMGMFVWTGWDYLGEPTPFTNKYPAKSSYFGIIDLAGFPKDIYYMYQSRWSNEPMIHIVGNWEYKVGETEGTEREIWVYSNCYKVNVFLNGTSCGEKTSSDLSGKYNYVYNIGYTPGTLVANGYDSGGTLVAQDVIYTSLGTVSQVQCYCDTSSITMNDYAFIECSLVDNNGVIVPTANETIEFSEVTGGTVTAVDAGNAASVEQMRSTSKKAFNGHIMAVVKPESSGTISLKTNYPTVMKESVKCGIEKVYRERATNFINAENPTIFTYYFDDPNFEELGSTIGMGTLESKATDESTGKTLKWSYGLTAIGYDSYIVSATSTGMYNEPINVDTSVNGVYSIVIPPIKNYSGITFTILEVNENKEIINTIKDITIEKTFALQSDTKYIMLNMSQQMTFSTTTFDDAEKVGIRSYPDYEFVQPTEIAFTGAINKVDTLIGESESIFDFITYSPADAYPAIQRNAMISSSNLDTADIEYTNIRYKALGQSTISIECGTASASTQLTISENTSEWSAEWDGSTNSIGDLFTLQSMKFVENTFSSGGTYMLVPTTTSGEVKVKNSSSGAAKFEVDVIFKGTTTASGWPWGMDITSGNKYGASIYIPGGSSTSLCFARGDNPTTQSFSTNTLYTLGLELSGSGSSATYTATMNGTTIVTDGAVTNRDLLTECKTWTTNENFVILGIRYNKSTT